MATVALIYTAAAEVTALNYNNLSSLDSVMKLGNEWVISTYGKRTETSLVVTNLSVNGVSKWSTLASMKAALTTVGLTVYRYYGSNGKLLGYGLTKTEEGCKMVADSAL